MEFRLFVVIWSNNGNKLAIMNKSCGQFWKMRAVDGKLKSDLEWPEPCNPLEAPALKGLFQRKKPIIEIAASLYTN